MTDRNQNELMEEIEALVGAAHSEREALRRTSVTTMVVSGTLLAIVAAFAIVNYIQFKTLWTEEKLTAGFQKELEVLNPAASDQLQALGKHLLPVYADAGRKQFVAMTPEIAERVKREIDHLGENLRDDTQTRLMKTTDRVSDQSREIAFAAYPGLDNESERERMTNTFRKLTEEAIVNATTEFTERFTKDIHEVQEHVQNFKTHNSEESAVELEKRFIHLWLQLLDAEIMKK